jgi:hypothetical protein
MMGSQFDETSPANQTVSRLFNLGVVEHTITVPSDDAYPADAAAEGAAGGAGWWC